MARQALIFGFLILAGVVSCKIASAQEIGIGVGLGSIVLREPLIPGQIYKLPKIPVINTGEVEGVAVVKVDFFGDQKEMRPSSEWFSFSPKTLSLDPDQSVMVATTLTLPFAPIPGKYMALIVAQYDQGKNGQVRLGPAAATKLYFEIGKSPSVLGAFRQRIQSLALNYPFWMLILAGVFILEALNILRKNFHLTLKISSRREGGRGRRVSG